MGVVCRRGECWPSADNIRPQTSYAMPEGIITIPTLNPILKTLDQVVDVDYYMPGCPPESHQITAVVELVIAALNGKAQLPPKGATIGAGDSTVCDECPRKQTKPANIAFTEFKRPHQLLMDPEKCFLAQGVVEQLVAVLRSKLDERVLDVGLAAHLGRRGHHAAAGCGLLPDGAG